MESLHPTINKLQKYNIPRPIAIILIYILVISLFSFTIAGIIPILLSQTGELIRVLPSTINNLNIFGFSAVDLSSQFKILETIPNQVAQAVLSLVSNIFSAFVILVITFYLLLERPKLANHCSRLTKNPNIKDLIVQFFCALELKMGNWVNGELILMTIIGLMSYVGYSLLGLPYALPLAIIAGILEIVPNIGPIITSVIAILIGLTVSPFVAFLTVLLSIFVHQSENNFITPKIMKEAIGLNPVITILTIATGAKLAGIGGALLSVPLYLTLETIITTVWKKKN
jgi:predicted PurR-regulated permease PerM